MKKINPVGFLSILATISILGIVTQNSGWYGFLGFLYYIKYFYVIPDENFWENIKKSSTLAFLVEMICLPIFLFFMYFTLDSQTYIQSAFGACFAISILVFTVYLTVLEWKEIN